MIVLGSTAAGLLSSVTAQRSVTVRRIGILAGAAAASLAVGACTINHKLPNPHYADNPALYVSAGRVTYQVQLSRQLNPFATEDSAYLAGVSPSLLSLAPDQLWFGVFLWARNQTPHRVTTSDTFTIRDSAGRVYHPVPIVRYANPWAWTAQELMPGGTEPAPDSMASYGPTQGGLILFKLNDSVYSNRPLTLNIYAPGQSFPTRISLDL
jgi:hypothetical protein